MEKENISQPNSTPAQPETHNVPTNQSKPRNTKVIIIAFFVIFALLIAGLVGAYTFGKKNMTPAPTPTPEAVACTMEAKLCPDGVTSVGRQGPKCEFAACPTTTATVSGKFELDKTYSSPDSWQIDYPGAFKLETRESQQMGPNGTGTPVVISYLGPTQGSGTEFHDGVSFSVGVQKKPANQNIKDTLDEYSKPNPELGGSRTELKPISVNGLSGYETTTEGLGSFRFIMLNYPGDNTKVYLMSIFADGPAPTGADYKAITDEMIESFRNI